VRKRGLFLVAPAACLAMIAAPGAQAAPGATLTVPAQVQTSQGANPVLQMTFTYPEATPFCTGGVDFTWDGAAWLSELPTKKGDLCVATGANARAPTGHGGAGAHQVCGSAGPQFRDCKQVNVVVAAGAAPAPAAAPPAPAPAAAPAATAAPAQAPINAAPASIASRYPKETVTGLVLLAVGLAGLAALFGRRLLVRLRRRKSTPLPDPGQRR
jgi:hypothetical protein